MFGKNREQKRRVIKKDGEEPNVVKKKPATSGNGFYYSFLTIILLLCLIQISVSAVLNVSKIISYKAKIVQITKTRDAAMAFNDQLKDSIKNFSKIDGMEAIARNNLKMSGEDEVLVIINTPDAAESAEQKVKFNLFEFLRRDNND